jgi:hypothetical protein
MAASFARQIAQLTSEKDAVTRALEAARIEVTTTSRAGEAALRQSEDALGALQREATAAKDELRVSKAELKSTLDRQLAERRELEKEIRRLAGLQRGSMASAAPGPVARRAPSAVRATAVRAAPVARAPVGPLPHAPFLNIASHGLIGWARRVVLVDIRRTFPIWVPCDVHEPMRTPPAQSGAVFRAEKSDERTWNGYYFKNGEKGGKPQYKNG